MYFYLLQEWLTSLAIFLRLARYRRPYLGNGLASLAIFKECIECAMIPLLKEWVGQPSKFLKDCIDFLIKGVGWPA